jgi:DNA polymerase-4
MAARRILHIDMDAFFAAIEQLRRPELRGRPVVVGGAGDPFRRGVVSTASYEARKYGIYSGMPLRTSYQRCPECVFLPVDYAHYAAISNRIKAILKTFSPVMEDAGIDEAFLELPEGETDAKGVALEIKRRIRAATGLTCSIGIAPNKLLAKLASDMDKPDGLVILAHDELETRVWPLPARRLWGVGPKTEEKLAAWGVTTIGELAQRSREQLVERFGQAHGQYLYRAARGMDDSPLIIHWEPLSFSRETTFGADVDDWAVLEATLDTLTRSAVERLRRQGYRANTVTVKLRYADFETHTHGCTLAAPSDDFDTIDHAAHRCLTRFPLTKKCRLIGVRVGGLQSA